MEVLTTVIVAGEQEAMVAALYKFTDENKANFKLGESLDTRERFCSAALSLLRGEGQVPPQILALTLHALRIFAREQPGVDQLIGREGLTVVARLARLVEPCDYSMTREELKVAVEATKVLCNVILNHRYLASLMAEVGCLNGLSIRLAAVHHTKLPDDLLFFDLRLLFLITACGPAERVAFREHCNGIPILINIVDATLFGPTPSLDGATTEITPTNKDEPSLKLSASTTVSMVISQEQCSVLCEALKILFNQTLHWREDSQYDEEELALWSQLSRLIRVLLVSLPLHRDKTTTDTIGHCAELLVNAPEQCAKYFLTPPDVQIMPALIGLYPDLYGSNDKDKLYTINLDTLFDDWNMCAVLALVNYLHLQLSQSRDGSRLSPVLTALRVLSRGHRSIRRYLRSIILPPLREVTQRPDEGDSLKSRVVRLMTAGSMGAEEVTAELLFVLCKENVSRLVKHTGFGNAAGLLMSRGLLGGGRSQGEEFYSSDSGGSDTEEYQHSRDKLNPVTAGPEGDEPSPLDHMTEEEMEQEAGKLVELFDKLDRHGVIKVMPVDKDGKPVLDRQYDSDESTK